jgi:fumarylacetoacetase
MSGTISSVRLPLQLAKKFPKSSRQTVSVRYFSAASRSWVNHDSDCSFPVQNLPFGVFSCPRRGPRCATAIGDNALDLAALADSGLLADLPFDAGSTFRQPTLNKFMALNRSAWRATRARLTELLIENGDDRLRRDSALCKAVLRPLQHVKMHLPAQIGDYTDFYASREHATNVGIMFRGRDNALQPNWLHLPVGYHGRASSVVVSGTPIARPRGQLQINREDPSEGSSYGPCKLLDYELEMGVFLGGGLPPIGRPVTIEEAEEHIFGYVILNDWSARDIQAWEYVPLGPFTAKNFATTISPWVVTPDALEPFKCPTSAGVQSSPEPLPYLRDPNYSSYDLKLEIDIRTPSKDGSTTTTTIAKSNFSHMYWTARQMLAHHSVSGCPMAPGDLLGSGTISGTIDDSKGESINYGSLLEQTWRGKNEVPLSDGGIRKFIQDGDSILMHGHCQGDGFRVGFGDCEGKILPAGALDSVKESASTITAPGLKFNDVVLKSYWRSSSSWRVRIALAHYGVPFVTEPVHLLKGVQRTEEYVQTSNSMGQVPALSFKDADGKLHTLTQSLAIIDFLDSTFGGQAGASPLVPLADGTAEGAFLRSRALEIAEVINSGIQPLQNLSVLNDLKEMKADAKKYAAEKNALGLAACEKLVAAADGRFAAGDVLTIADVCLIPQLYGARRFEVDLTPYPNLLRVEATCMELASFKAAHPDLQPDYAP